MLSLNLMLILSMILAAVLVFAISNLLRQILGDKRNQVLKRLQSRYFTTPSVIEEEDILSQPFIDRTVGHVARYLVKTMGEITPIKLQNRIGQKLEEAGNPRNLKAGDILALMSIAAMGVGVTSYFLVAMTFNTTPFMTNIISLSLFLLAGYMPIMSLNVIADQRQAEVRRRLPEIMDMMVVSVEAGLAFDMALARVVERFRGTIAEEFRRALREMNLGKPRKEALKDVADRVKLPELSALVNAVIQSEQLGVGIGDVLRLQADLIREKRQQWIEEQAMKAPIKMLFPLVFLVFPSIFVIVLGPAIISIRHALNM